MLQLSTRPMPFAALLLALTVYMGYAVPHSQLPALPSLPAVGSLAQAQPQPQHLGQPPVVKAALHSEQPTAPPAGQRPAR